MEEKNKKMMVGNNKNVFIIAEAGVNHNGDVKLAKKLVDVAVNAGVDAVKFQTFKSEKIVTADADQAKYQTKNIGKTETQYEMLKRLELSYHEFRELKKYCDTKDIIFLSTPHSCKEDVDLVAKLCPMIKVASGDLTNIPFLKYIAEKQLPVVLSTGMGNMQEIEEAVNIILPINRKLTILHCTTNYPTPFDEANVYAVSTLQNRFNLPIGFSDHTEGILASQIAVVLGAKVIEKHFTLDKAMKGPDHKASLDPSELKELVDSINTIVVTLGDGIVVPYQSEINIAKVARKSIVSSVNISIGTRITKDMLVIKRPGYGIQPKYLDRVIGKTTRQDILQDEIITWEKI